jgi:tetratricopeptide (TPR) repeat protein
LGVLPAPRAAELAWHFLEGDDPERALRYALLAGDQAEAVFAHEEAERQYRAVLELTREVSDQAREAEATGKLGSVLRITGRYDEALELLERAAQQYRRSGDLPGESRTIAQIGRVHARRETTEEGITRLQAAIDGIEGTEEQENLAELYVVLSYLYFVTGRYSEMLAAAERASKLASAVGNNKILAEAELRRATALVKLGQHAQGEVVLEELIPLSEAAGDLDTLARVLNNVGWSYYLGGDFIRSRAYRLRALEVARTQGDPNTLAFALTMLCQELYASGEWAEARAYAEQAVDLARSIGLSHSLPYALGWRGWMHTVQGEWEAAAEDLQQALRMAETTGDMQALGMVHTFLAELDLLQGHPERALAGLDPLIGRADIAEEDKGWLLPRLAWAYLELGHERAAEEVIEDAVGRTRANADRWDLVEALRIQGMLKARQERWDEAVDAFEEGISLARGMPYSYAEARALYEEGMMHVRKGERQQAQDRLREALVLFDGLGARSYIECTEHALADVGRNPLTPQTPSPEFGRGGVEPE